MYTSFRVQNFRCFRDLRLNDLGRVNLIAGKNNAGKTALLEAMYIHTELSPPVLFNLQQARGLDVPNDNLPTYWKQYFYGMDSTAPIEIDGQGTFSSEFSKLSITEIVNTAEDARASKIYLEYLSKWGIHLSEALKLTENMDAILEFILSGNDGQMKKALLTQSNLLDVYPILGEKRSNFIPVHGRPDKQTVADQFSYLEISGELPKLIEVLQIFEPRLSDLRLLSPDSEIIIWGQVNGSRIPLRLMGEGMNRVSHFLLTMMTNPKTYLFIDEIENGFHYSIQKDVWKVIGQLAHESNIQVFATTHSLEMIRAAHEAFKDDDPYDFRYHRLDRDSFTGAIEAVTYNQFGMEAVAAFDFDYEVRG